MGRDRGQIKSGCGGCGSKSSPLEDKFKGKCGKKEEPKKESCADRKQADETSRRADQECVCGSSTSNSSFKKKKEEKCPSTNKKRKCDSSQEAFRKGLKGNENIDKEECNSSYAEFLKGRDKNRAVPSEKSSNQCEDSYKNITPIENKVQSTCCTEPIEDIAYSSNNGPCSKVDTSETKKAQGCAASVEVKDKTVSKTSCNECSELTKNYVKHDICTEGSIMQKTLDACGGQAEDSRGKKHPCPPSVEAGVTKVQKVTCPRYSAQESISNFFPLDARNKELNKCIDKYINVDPSQVISKCSQYANASVVKSAECAEIDKKIQRGCSQPRDRRSGPPTGLGQGRHRQLLRRWAPSAAVYIAASTVTLFWVTEWKEPLQVVRQSVEGAFQRSTATKEE